MNYSTQLTLQRMGQWLSSVGGAGVSFTEASLFLTVVTGLTPSRDVGA